MLAGVLGRRPSLLVRYEAFHRNTPYLITLALGWVAYSMNALISAVGENRLMPLPDCQCITINGRTGYVRANSSWVIGRLVRDYEFWMHRDVKSTLDDVIDSEWEEPRIKAHEQYEPEPCRPTQAGLCVSIYKATQDRMSLGLISPGLLCTSCFVAVLKLGIAAIPCGIFGDWSILTITACGIALYVNRKPSSMEKGKMGLQTPPTKLQQESCLLKRQWKSACHCNHWHR